MCRSAAQRVSVRTLLHVHCVLSRFALIAADEPWVRRRSGRTALALRTNLGYDGAFNERRWRCGKARERSEEREERSGRGEEEEGQRKEERDVRGIWRIRMNGRQARA